MTRDKVNPELFPTIIKELLDKLDYRLNQKGDGIYSSI